MKANYEARSPAPVSSARGEISPLRGGKDFERVRDLHAEMTAYVKSLGRNRKPGPLERMSPRKFIPQDYEEMSFLPNIYDVEPAALDDLLEAKKRGDASEIENIRSIIRSFSWTSHGRTDPEVAASLARNLKHLAQDLKKEATERTKNEASNPFKKDQGAFSYAAPEESAKWAEVERAVGNMECKGEALEKAVDFVEKKIVETWKEFLEPYQTKNRKERPPWPSSHPAIDAPVLPHAVEQLTERLTSMRHIRDQLYFQRLYPKLCAFGSRGITK